MAQHGDELFAAARDAGVQLRFDAEETLRMLALHRADIVYLVPTMMKRIWRLPSEVRESYDLSSLRVMFTGGEAVPYDRAVAFEMEVLAVNAIQGFAEVIQQQLFDANSLVITGPIDGRRRLRRIRYR